MHLRITADCNSESGVGEVAGELSGPTRKHFVPKDYGGGLLGVVVVLTVPKSCFEFQAANPPFKERQETLHGHHA